MQDYALRPCVQDWSAPLLPGLAGNIAIGVVHRANALPLSFFLPSHLLVPAGTSGDGGAPLSATFFPYSLAYRASTGTLVVYSPLHGNVREIDLANNVVNRIMGADSPAAGSNLGPITNATIRGQSFATGWSNTSFLNNSAWMQGMDVSATDNVVICGGARVLGFKIGGSGLHSYTIGANALACAVDFDGEGVVSVGW